jgi:hypothetical protein
MANSTAHGQPSGTVKGCSYSIPQLEEMRQTFPSRLAYHQHVSLKAGRLPLSKEIGLLLWLSSRDLLNTWGGERRLVLLQRKASFEALVAAIAFQRRLNTDSKLQLDLYHHAVVLNSHLPEKEFRRREQRRIGIGYRDKGTLPNFSSRARKSAESFGWYRVEDVGRELADGFPIEGEWVDLSSILTGENFPLP